MVLLNSLKVLSTNTRQSLLVEHAPEKALQKNLLLSSKLFLNVEIFPLSEISVFARSEPVYFIDGYLRVVDGRAEIAACRSSSFFDQEALSLCSGSFVSRADALDAVKKMADELVGAALRKAGNAFFGLRSAPSLRVCVFLIKINEMDRAVRQIEEKKEHTEGFFESVSYLIYETYGMLLRNSPSDEVVDKVFQVSSLFSREPASELEDRAICCVLVALDRTHGEVSRKILDLHMRSRISSEKKPLFFYLLSRYVGKSHRAARCGFVSFVLDAFGCRSCSHRRYECARRSLEGLMVSESDLAVEKAARDKLSSEFHISSETNTSPAVSIVSDIGQCVVEKTGDVFVSKFESVYSTDKVCCVFTEGAVAMVCKEEVFGVLVEKSEDTEVVVVKESSISSCRRKEAFIRSTNSSGGAHYFFFPDSCLVTGIVIRSRQKQFTKPVKITVKIVAPPDQKRILAHRYLSVPVVSAEGTTEEEAVGKKVSEFVEGPFSLVSCDPVVVRFPFSDGDASLYKDVGLGWSTVCVASVKETENAFVFSSFLNPIEFFSSRGSFVVIPGKALEMPKEEVPNELEWRFSDRSKSGAIRIGR